MKDLLVRQIVGTPSDNSWSQVWEFIPKDKEKISQRGNLILLVSVENDDQAEVASLGREIISRFHEEYFGDLRNSINEHLEAILTKIGQEKPIFIKSSVKVNLGALITQGDQVFLGSFGEINFILEREKKQGILLRGKEKQTKTLVGPIQENDLFLIASEKFLQAVPTGTLNAALSSQSLDEAFEMLAPLVHAREAQGSLAAILLLTGKELKTEIEELVSEESQFLEGAEVGNQLAEEPTRSLVSPKKPGFTLISLASKLKARIASLRPKEVSVGLRSRAGVKPRRKAAISVGIGFLFLLMISTFLGWKKREARQRFEQFENLYQQIEEKLASAEAIKNIAPSDSLELIKSAQQLAIDLEGLNLDAEKTNRLKERTDSLAAFLGGVGKVKPELFFDLSLITEPVRGTDFYLDKENLLVLDQSEGKLISINVTKKSGELIIQDDKLKSKEQIAGYSGRVYFWGKEGIDELEGKKLNSVVEADEEWQDVRGLATWLGNLYLLEGEKGLIWKYPVVNDGFGKKQPWLREEGTINNARGFAIDGRIWILLKNGTIKKIYSGRSEEFSQTLSEEIPNPTFVGVSPETDKVCLFEETEKVVWCFSKEGEFMGKTVLDLNSVQDMALTDDKVLILSEGKIYFLSLI